MNFELEPRYREIQAEARALAARRRHRLEVLEEVALLELLAEIGLARDLVAAGVSVERQSAAGRGADWMARRYFRRRSVRSVAESMSVSIRSLRNGGSPVTMR